MQRSPPGLGGVSSSPDLRDLHDEFPPSAHTHILKRKRKQPDTTDITEVLEGFTNNIRQTLEQWQSRLDTALSEFQSGAQQLRTELADLRAEHVALNNIVIVLRQQQRDLANKVQDLERAAEHGAADRADLKSCIEERPTRADHQRLQDEVRSLHTQLDGFRAVERRQQQRARINNIEIAGVPEHKAENLSNVVDRICKYIGYELQSTSIESATRVRSFDVRPDRPRNIIVKMNKRLCKDEFLSKARRFRDLDTKRLGFTDGDPRRVYINEHLTPENKQLHKQVRCRAKELNYSYVWIRNCAIHVRKNEKSPHLTIYSEADLNKLV